MAEAIDDRVMRTTCRRLTNTASLLKGAWRRVRNNRPDADVTEVDDLQEEVLELMEKGRRIRAGAVAAGIDTQRLDKALAMAERKARETADGFSSGRSTHSPSSDESAHSNTPSEASIKTNPEREQKENERPRIPSPIEDRHELVYHILKIERGPKI